MKVIALYDYCVYKILDKFASWVCRREHFGAFRFRVVRVLYKMIPRFPTLRNDRWDFIFDYLPPLNFVNWRGLKVLDIGCAGSLLIYELKRRHYLVAGLDINDYPAPLPHDIKFYKCNIMAKELPPALSNEVFDYIIATSVIENIGTDKYNEGKAQNGDRLAIQNIYNMLSDAGYFILTLPILNWRYAKGRGYILGDILKLIEGLFFIFEITQRCGNFCIVLVKLAPSTTGKPTLMTTR